MHYDVLSETTFPSEMLKINFVLELLRGQPLVCADAHYAKGQLKDMSFDRFFFTLL